MKKQSLLSAVILLTITFLLVSNITQANAQCYIEWTGTMSGYAPANEINTMEDDVHEAFLAIFGHEPDGGCGNMGTYYMCVSDTGEATGEDGAWISLEGDGWSEIRCCVTPVVDTDSDAICDGVDNCQYRYNPAQTDWDSDFVGDTCDTETQDNDGDGVDNRIDNCDSALNFYQLDADNDNIGDVCDSVPGCGGCGQPNCEPVR